jgi:hypothetical protein
LVAQEATAAVVIGLVIILAASLHSRLSGRPF